MQIIQQINVFKNVQVTQTTFLKIKLILVYILVLQLLLCLLTTQLEDVSNIALEGISRLLLTILQDNVCLFVLMEHICKIQLVLASVIANKDSQTHDLNFAEIYALRIIMVCYLKEFVFKYVRLQLLNFTHKIIHECVNPPADKSMAHLKILQLNDVFLFVQLNMDSMPSQLIEFVKQDV